MLIVASLSLFQSIDVERLLILYRDDEDNGDGGVEIGRPLLGGMVSS